jgi:hypothetical protein
MVKGYHDSDGYRDEPLDNRDEENPEYIIDPMLSGTHADGGEHRVLRHKTAEPTLKSPADMATFDPRDEEEA